MDQGAKKTEKCPLAGTGTKIEFPRANASLLRSIHAKESTLSRFRTVGDAQVFGNKAYHSNGLDYSPNKNRTELIERL